MNICKSEEEFSMKSAKKIIALILAFSMLFAFCVPAFASDEGEAAKPFDNSEYFQYENLTIHYRVFKAENEKGKIFMIHGFALSGYCWEELATRLVKEGYTCVAADLPDFGYSTRETSSENLPAREDVMYALMSSLSSEKWYVAGHSMGGYIALKLAEKYPDSVKNLLLYGTAYNKGHSDTLNGMMTNKVFVSVMAPLMELMAKFDCVVRLMLYAGLMDAEYTKNYDLSKITAPLRIKGTGAGALYSFSTLPQTNLEAVEKMPPILYVNGDRDFVIPAADREVLREHLPEGSVDAVVSGGGHMFIENMADETAEITLSFLKNNQ